MSSTLHQLTLSNTLDPPQYFPPITHTQLNNHSTSSSMFRPFVPYQDVHAQPQRHSNHPLDRSQRTLQNGEKLRSQRLDLLRGLPEQTCAFISAADLLAGSKWPSRCAILKPKMPALTAFFASNAHQHNPTSYTDLFREIVDGGNTLGTTLQAPEDPYVIIDVVRRIILSFTSPFSLLPRFTSPCGSSDCPPIEGDLEYDRGFNGGYSISTFTCARCGQDGVPGL